MPLPPLPAADLDAILTLTAPLWAEMRGERLFLTGGTGFFGCWLTESFLHINRALSLDARLTVLTRSPEAFLSKLPHLRDEPALTLLAGDVRTFACAEPHAYIIHAATAASAAQAANAPAEMLSTILDGTAHTLRFAAAAGARKLLFTSSGAVYGPADGSPTKENTSFAPDPLLKSSVYAEGKRAAETMCAVAASEHLEIKVARCWAFLGPHLPLDAHFAAGNFLADALAGRAIHIASGGRAVRSYLYASDLAVWLWMMLFKAPSLRAFNVGSSVPITIRDLAEAVAVSVDPPLDVTVGSAPGAQTYYVPSTERAAAELNLHQTVSLADALARTIQWHRSRTDRIPG